MNFRASFWLLIALKLATVENSEYLKKRSESLDKCLMKLDRPGLITLRPMARQNSICLVMMSAPETSQIRVNVISVGSGVKCGEQEVMFINGLVVGKTIFPKGDLMHPRGKELCRTGSTIHADLNAATIFYRFNGADQVEDEEAFDADPREFLRILIGHVHLPTPPCHFVVFKPEIAQKHVILDKSGCQALITRPFRILVDQTSRNPVESTFMKVMSKNSMNNDDAQFGDPILAGKGIQRDVPCQINSVEMIEDGHAKSRGTRAIQFDHAPLEDVHSQAKTRALLKIGQYLCGAGDDLKPKKRV